VAKPREIEGLAADDSYGEAAAKVVSVRAAEVTEHARGVLDTSEIERLHAMRVATRRLRAALEIFEPCFPAKPHRRALREVKRLADGLGERRDRDVAIAALGSFAEQVPDAGRNGVAGLVERLRAEQERANAELVPLVDVESLTAIEQSLHELVASVER
jgi:CHAD domain-containing protein